MYEIWLALNIGWEIATGMALVLLAAGAAWLVLWMAAIRKRSAAWRSGLRAAVLIGLVAAVAVFLLLPGWTKSSLGELGYFFDVLALLGLAVGTGAVVASFAWPLVAMFKTKRA